MNRRVNNRAALALLALFAFGGGAYAQIQDFGTGGPQVTRSESRTGTTGQHGQSSGAGGQGTMASPQPGGGMTQGSGGGETARSASGASAAPRSVMYTILPWVFVVVVLGGAASWLAGSRSRKGQEATVHGGMPASPQGESETH